MAKPDAIVPARIRNIRHCTFGWVDHNFLHHGHLNRSSPPELLLYYFLLTVADRNGVSFYDYERICQFLKMEGDDYVRARNHLCERSLIAYQNGIFQVLSLPESTPVPGPARGQFHRFASQDFQSLKTILQHLRHDSEA
jgi:hypothetical protein